MPADVDVTATFVGADGLVVGVAELDVVDGPFPTAFDGTTVNVYAVPPFKPVNDNEVVFDV